jgi:hypothetical protein
MLGLLKCEDSDAGSSATSQQALEGAGQNQRLLVARLLRSCR